MRLFIRLQLADCQAVTKRPCFAMRNTAFCIVKDGLLACNIRSFIKRKAMVCMAAGKRRPFQKHSFSISTMFLDLPIV